MAAGLLTKVADVVVPAHFTAYVQQLTEEKSRLIQSGALARNQLIDGFLAGGGLTFNIPSYRDLDNDADNVSTDTVDDAITWTDLSGDSVGANYPALGNAVPLKIQSSTEVGVRLSRNNSWSAADLAADLAGKDPMQAIGDRVATYWARRLQAIFVATLGGVFKDNTTNDSGDYTVDISGASFIDGVTNFSADALIDAQTTMGDSRDSLALLCVHSAVMGRMKKNNLIDFIPDSEGRVSIPTFQGLIVVEDDGMPRSGSVYESWLFGMGALQLGVGAAKVPTEVSRYALAGNGGGQEVLTSRVEWCVHPTGHAWTGTAANGGPGNGTSANQLNHVSSWNRVYPERKQVKIARLITREA